MMPLENTNVMYGNTVFIYYHFFSLFDSPKEAYESMVDNTRHFPIADLTHRMFFTQVCAMDGGRKWNSGT